jgi:glycosyltransferase involved in cell wall biosynthesis
LVADGYIANYRDVLNELPLILVTSNWVKEVYIRDGIKGDNIEVLPVGCNTDVFRPYEKSHAKVIAAREMMEVSPDQLLILTVGGDAASKGAQEIMQALAMIDSSQVPDWRYVCKVWPQSRTKIQNEADRKLAAKLGIEKKVDFITYTTSRNIMPYLLGACDIYAAPSRLEGFGMAQVEAGACERPVLGIQAMGMLDTLVDGETAFLASVAKQVVVKEMTLGKESGFEEKQRIVLDPPRIMEYRANPEDLAGYLTQLMNDPALRDKMGRAGRQRVVEHFDYRVVARRFVQIIHEKLGI